MGNGGKLKVVTPPSRGVGVEMGFLALLVRGSLSSISRFRFRSVKEPGSDQSMAETATDHNCTTEGR